MTRMNAAVTRSGAFRSLSIASLLRPFWYHGAKHVYRLFRDAEYRRYVWLSAKYGGTPRYCRRTVRVGDLKLTVPDVASFLSAYHDIFVEDIYDFPFDRDDPEIIDCGANIGVSILYFKKRFPRCRITAYEADPTIFALLKDNIVANGLTDIELVNKAVWSSDAGVRFTVEGADGGRIGSEEGRTVIIVPSVSLATALGFRSYDFLKLDIEGAECEALIASDEQLGGLRYVFVEFHSFAGRTQELGRLIGLFDRKGFRVHIHPPFTAKRPFLGIVCQDGMDMQLNLFFWKDTHEAA